MSNPKYPNNCSYDKNSPLADEAKHVAKQIHDTWPHIDEEEALDFYMHLGHVSLGEGSTRVCLWVLAKVLEHNSSR